MKGKDIIYEYVKEITENSNVDYILKCEDLLRIFDGYSDENVEDIGCPSAFGLDDYKGDCYINLKNYNCKQCWQKALESEVN